MTADYERCNALFDFFLHVVTVCSRPKHHWGQHHPTALACDRLQPVRVELTAEETAEHRRRAEQIIQEATDAA